MEENTFGELPPEVWSHILTFIAGLDDLINLKSVNRLFSKELKDPSQAFIGSLNIRQDVLQYYSDRDTTYSIPREQLLNAWRRGPYNTSPNKEIRVKCVLLGRSGVGKTSFNNNLVGRPYREEYEPTMGHDFVNKKFTDPDGITTTIQIWDRGQAKFSPLVVFAPYYMGMRVLLLCFSVDNRDSFKQLIDEYVPGVCQDMKNGLFSDLPAMYLLGLKSDLVDTRQVSKNEAKILARTLKIKYCECSAKSGHNVQEIAQRIKDDLLEQIRTPDPKAGEARRWCSIL